MIPLSERDKLVWKLAHTAHALTDAIRCAMEMSRDEDGEEDAVRHLRHAADVGRELLK